MRLVLDIRHRSTRSGAVSYIDNLAPRLVRLCAGEVIVLRSSAQRAPADIEAEEVVVPARPGAVQAVHDQVGLPRLLKRLGADVYHPLKYLGSMFPPCDQVTTAHAITEPFGGVFPIGRTEAVYWTHMGRRILRSSAAVIAVSEYIREFLLARIGIPAERITVIPNGIDPQFRPLPAGSAAPSEPYLLTVGNIFPVKNFGMAVDMLAGLRDEYPRLRLRMAGATSDPHFASVRERAQRAGVLDRIDFLGYVPAAELVRLMNDALLLLMPSLTEGCPVTLLEAMACGTPVLASARGGIPEVGGDAVALVQDPLAAEDWIRAARDLLRDDARRTGMSRRGVDRAAHFTWDRAAAATVQVYERLATR